MTIPLRAMALVVVAAAVGACGFQLRGWDMAAAIDSAYVTSDMHNPLEAPLRQGLRQANVREAATPAEAQVVVRLMDSRSERRSITVSEQARAAEYETILSVLYEVTDPEGRQLVAPQWLERARVFRVDRDNVVGTREEQALLEGEMQNDLVQQIIRSINAVVGSGDAT
ncbi:MAG: LPS assembly lipoprotein LptE [Pseudomonadales bacterium]